MWTIAKRFYTPDANVAPATNLNKVLKTLSWKDTVAAASFPAALLPTALEASQTMRYNGTKAADLRLDDLHLCGRSARSMWPSPALASPNFDATWWR